MNGLSRMKRRPKESRAKRHYDIFPETGGGLSPADKIFLSARVKAAVLVTKGIRGLDYLDSNVEIGKFPELVQTIGGAQDKLVVPQQLTEFSLRLDQLKIKHELIRLQGDQSTHLFPQTMPDDVYNIILESITRP